MWGVIILVKLWEVFFVDIKILLLFCFDSCELFEIIINGLC